MENDKSSKIDEQIKSRLRSKMGAKDSDGSSFATGHQVGAGTKMAKDFKNQSFAIKRWLDKRRKLKIPQSILDANPDKHFAWVKADEIVQSGGFHQNGYRMYRRPKNGNLEHDNDAQDFGSNGFSMDSVLRRRELVLGWIPIEEKAERDEDFDFVRRRNRGADVVTSNPDLRDTDVTAEVTREKITFKEQ